MGQRRGGTRRHPTDHGQEPDEEHRHPRADEAPDEHAHAAVEHARIRRRPTIPRTLKVLLALLVLVTAALAVVGQDARWRRTAEAEVRITEIDLQGSPHPGISAGRLVRYEFLVDGETHRGIVIRSWTITSIREAKVCYEPAKPDNQILVKRAATCPS